MDSSRRMFASLSRSATAYIAWRPDLRCDQNKTRWRLSSTSTDTERGPVEIQRMRYLSFIAKCWSDRF